MNKALAVTACAAAIAAARAIKRNGVISDEEEEGVEHETVLSLTNLSKTYPGVKALKNVSLDVRRGEVHAIVGENGAGKSTLIKAIAGAISPDAGSGSIVVDGRTFHSLSPHEARELGIEVIYQEFNLAPDVSVMENMFMGFFPDKSGLVDFKGMEKHAREVFAMMKVDIDPRVRVRYLSVAYMQLVEIAKAITRKAKILIMDEPTAPLTNNEVDLLFDLIKRLREQKITIIYISHRLNEIFDISDRVTVMRDGEIISTHDTSEMTREQLVKQMVGRTLGETFPVRKREKREELLRVEHLSGRKVKDISFSLHQGEIFCLAGLVGAGRTETMRFLYGADRMESGDIYYQGKKVRVHSPTNAIALGLGMVPEDRMNHGVSLELSIRHNIALAIIRRISKLLFINSRKEKEIVNQQSASLRIKADSLNTAVKKLSGGNQQKVVLAKWLAANTEVLLLDEPTRGIDVGAKQEIYKLMNELTKQGVGILLISSEMEEVLGLADRVLVLFEGKAMGFVEAGTPAFTQENILTLASGYA